jgi:hypothetical protein
MWVLPDVLHAIGGSRMLQLRCNPGRWEEACYCMVVCFCALSCSTQSLFDETFTAFDPAL